MTTLDEIAARVRDCRTYNFGMRNADRLAHVDAPAMSAALRAVIDLHRPCDNNSARTPQCGTCQGKAGVWECGCWADEDRHPVCSTCTEIGEVHPLPHAAPWPCPTVLAITTHLEGTP